MKREKELKSRGLGVLITISEYNSLQEKFKSTTFKVFSDYIRALLRQEPVVKKYRNQSFDDILQALVKLKNEVEGVGRNFSDAIDTLKSLAPGVPQKEALEYLLAEAFSVKMNVDHIKATLIKIYEECVRGDMALQG